DPFHGVGRGHGAAVVIAVRQIDGVAEFMDRFFNHALAKQFRVGEKAVYLLAQPVHGDHGAGSTHLRLAENEGKNRDVQIDGGYAQHSPGVGGKKTLHALQDFRRVVLLPFSMERELGIQPDWEHFAGDAESFFDGGPQILQQPVIYISDRQQLQQLHGAVLSSSSQFSVNPDSN